MNLASMRDLLTRCMLFAVRVLRDCENTDQDDLCEEAGDLAEEIDEVLEPPDRN